jgi:hypothetical protein
MLQRCYFIQCFVHLFTGGGCKTHAGTGGQQLRRQFNRSRFVIRREASAANSTRNLRNKKVVKSNKKYRWVPNVLPHCVTSVQLL